MKRSNCYEGDWRQYAFPEQACHFTTEEELAARYSFVDLDGGPKAGGMPILSDGRNIIVNTENEHALVFGGTASKKTRTLIIPTILSLAQAKESMVIMDVKGELSNGSSFPEILGTLEANGYTCRFFNLRELNGDAFNLLREPYSLYRSGQKGEAMRMVNDIVEGWASIYHGSKADPFWEMTAKPYLIAVLQLMFEMCDDEKKINLLTLVSYMDWNSCESMSQVAALIESNSNTMTMLRNVTSEPEKTRMSTLATANSMLSPYTSNEKLLRMLSNSTFDIHQLHQNPTALFIIVPDEVDTYAGIVGMMLQQIASTLVQDAYALGGSLKRRVNLVCDEFCNYYIPGMARAISAHRSRNIRWFLVCQSLKQLEACYPKEADTIIANCTNIYFLSSPELSLLEYLSRRSGTITVTEDGSPRPLISVSDLQGLKKGWSHTDVYFTAGNLHYVSPMPDVSQYSLSRKYRKAATMPPRTYPTPPVYAANQMCQDVRVIRSAWEYKKRGKSLTQLEAYYAGRYEKLFIED